MNMSEAIARVVIGGNLSQDEMTEIMKLIMTGEATASQIGGFLVGLQIKGETVDEISGAALVMRELAMKVEVDTTGLLDTCGTGGSGSNKFNISTASAFVASAAGARVAKHGNRGASSNSGSADLLEEAGANIVLQPYQVARCIDNIGLGFLFAVSHHSAMKHAIGVRREMAVRTIFNLLGPLTNPAGAKRQLLGVFDQKWLTAIADVLENLGSEHVMVVHSEDGLDEISIAAPTNVSELKNGSVTNYKITPEQFGFERGSLDSLKVKNSEESLALVYSALSGKNDRASDIVALNAGAAIYVSGTASSLGYGVEMARDAIGSGLALEKMKDFIDFTNQVAVNG
ncbi:MAG: anthranilate phosphoribosyltransferase [Gammaproteobacteria bacterium TMED1]|jgi:anthranilate phosphoribosyltransferase|nr:MAG: anthranilate phosphoribosyltransferase [Gammaproteobacteria bacterium TMED1]